MTKERDDIHGDDDETIRPAAAPRHIPATDVTTEKARTNARLSAESTRAKGGHRSQDGSVARNEPGQAVHGADAHVQHDENTDRGADDLYRTESDNEVTEWRRHSALDAPPARAGYVQRFIRVRLGTSRDMARYVAATREGWRPVKASSVTDRSLPTTQLENGMEVIGVEDLILCEMPQKVFMQRQAYYQDKLDKQNAAIERQLREVGAKGGSGFGPIEQTRQSSISVRARTPGLSRGSVQVAGDD
jgi:hypothetical protein